MARPYELPDTALPVNENFKLSLTIYVDNAKKILVDLTAPQRRVLQM